MGKKLFKAIYKLHKWMGIPMLILFTMWYISGIVMLYHDFPRLTNSERIENTATYDEINELWMQLPSDFKSCRFTFSGNHLQVLCDNNLYGGYSPTQTDLEEIATFMGEKINHIDTLSSLDKWIPFGNYTALLPIYRIVSEDKTFIYVSSVNGEILQRATYSQRLWSWIGSLPHYVYITPLRIHLQAWKDVIKVIAGICTLSVILGLIIAIRFLMRKRTFQVFKKSWWKWHYILGVIFGLFTFTFIFSGMISVVDTSTWFEDKKTDIPKLTKSDFEIRQLTGSFKVLQLSALPIPNIKVTDSEGEKIKVPISSATLDFSVEKVTSVIEKITGQKVNNIKTIDNTVFYYKNGEKAYQTETDDFTVYWNSNGTFTILNRSSKARIILYRLLHTWSLPFFNSHPILLKYFMWIILVGGLGIVLTGGVLSFQAVARQK